MIKKILIIGGSGFLGSNLGAYLAEHDYKVYSFDLEYPPEKMEGMDCIVHAVSTINPGNSNQMYIYGYEKDFLQTVKLCNLLLGKK